MNADLSTRRNNPPQIVEFRALGLEHGRVDKANGVIRDVSLITGGIGARGHDLEVDDTTLQQINELATEMGQVPVKWNHKTGADSVNGFLQNFAINGNKVKGDWHLLKTHSQYEQAMELAERMPQNVGLSVAFVQGPPETKNGKKFARVEELVSVDLVAQPAANPGGLFESGSGGAVDTRRSGNMNTATGNANGNGPAAGNVEEPTIKDLFELLKAQTEELTSLREQVSAIQNGGGENEGLTAEELNAVAQLSDGELQQLGLTRAEVDAAVADAMAGGEGDVDGDPNAAGGGDGNTFVATGANGNGNAAAGAAAGAGAGAGAGGAGAGAGAGAFSIQQLLTEFGQLKRFVTNFQRSQEVAKEREEANAVEGLFGALEEKVTRLQAERDAALAAFEAGGGSVSANGEFVAPAGTNGAANNGPQTEFEQLVDQKVTADTRQVSLAVKRAQAIRELQQSNRKAYETHLAAKGAKITNFGR